MYKRDDFHLIAALEGELKAAISLRQLAQPPLDSQPQSPLHDQSPGLPRQSPQQDWLMLINLMYDGAPAGVLSFNLMGYDRDEAENLARNIHSNHYLMQEIDQYLWGESD